MPSTTSLTDSAIQIKRAIDEKEKWRAKSRQALTDLVEIKRKLAGQRAVESRLQERRPPVGPAVRSALVLFAHAAHSRVNRLLFRKWGKKEGKKMRRCLLCSLKSKQYLAAVEVLDGRLAKEKIDVIAESERADEIGSCKRRQRVLSTTQQPKYENSKKKKKKIRCGFFTVQMFKVVLLGAQRVLVDERVEPGKVGHGARVQFAI